MGTVTPSFAKTAWIWDLRLVRRWTSLALVADEFAQFPQAVAGRSRPRPDVPGGADRPGPWRRVRRSLPADAPSCCRADGPGGPLPRTLGSHRPPSTSRRSLRVSLLGARRPWPVRPPRRRGRCRCGPSRASRPRLVPPHDHAASPVQVDADILLLLFHGSLLLSSPSWFGNPKCALHTWSRATGGLPRALRFGSGRRGDFPRGHA